MNSYLIPANTKQGQLIFGIFRPVDLILLASGVITSFILLLLLPIDSVGTAILVLTPGLICAGLVIPIPCYHNILIVVTEFFAFLTSRQKYIWKGWCASDEKEQN